MGRILLVLAVSTACTSASACFAPADRPTACAADRSCPTGLVCVDQPEPRCLAPSPADADDGLAADGPSDGGADAVPADAAPDTDGDAVADAVDNCPAVANPGQANEDADPLGNACDPCPHLAGADAAAAAADGDTDGVGDACDPQPTQPLESIALFLPFDDPADLSELEPATAGAWSISGGALRSNVGAGEISAIWSQRQFAPRGLVVTALRPAVLEAPNAGAHSVAVLREVTAGNRAGVACFQADGNTPDAGWAPALGIDSLGANTGTTPYPDATQVDRRYVMAASRQGGQRTCRITSMGSADAVINSGAGGQGTGVGLRVRAADVAFEYLLVIDSV